MYCPCLSRRQVNIPVLDQEHDFEYSPPCCHNLWDTGRWGDIDSEFFNPETPRST